PSLSTLSLHDALPILRGGALLRGEAVRRAGCAAPHPAPAAAAFVEGDLGLRLAGGRDGARSDPAAGARRSFGIRPRRRPLPDPRSEEHTSELQSPYDL